MSKNLIKEYVKEIFGESLISEKCSCSEMSQDEKCESCSMNETSSFRKGVRVSLIPEKWHDRLQVPKDLNGVVLFSGQPYGKGHRTLVQTSDGQKYWTATSNLEIAKIENLQEKDIDEVAPEGWEDTVKGMKKHKEIDNPWALAWSMKKKGAKPRK